MRLAVLTALLLAAALAGPAHAIVLVDEHGAPQGMTWLERMRAPLPAGELELKRDRCPYAFPGDTGAVSCFVFDDQAIYLDRRHGRFQLAHELGHVFSAQSGSVLRRDFRVIFNLRRPWGGLVTPDVVLVGWAEPEELFAEGYARCSYYGARHARRAVGAYGYNPTPLQHARVCSAIVREAIRQQASGELRRHTAETPP